MDNINFQDILRITGGVSSCQADFPITGAQTDSRKVKEGDLFVCIEGERVDGHTFIDTAAKNGAVCALVSKDVDCSPIPTVKVKSTQEALILIAREYYSIVSPFTVAVTGSCGKTTTKDMLAEVFSAKGNVAKTPGNYNSTIGLPLTVCMLSQKTKNAVLELGINHPGEMAQMCRVIQPDIAVITNIGTSHIEFFDTMENIMHEKTLLYKAVKPGGTIVVNADDDLLATVMDEEMPQIKKITYGIVNDADVMAYNIEMFNMDAGITTEFDIKIKSDSPTFTSITVHALIYSLGEHNVYNALAAVAAGVAAGINPGRIAANLKNFVADDMRLSVKKCKDGVTVISDVYNSNPQAATAALKAMSNIANGRKIAILGDMLELGMSEKDAHAELGRIAAKHANFIITRGRMAIYTAGGAAEVTSYKNIQTVSSNEQAIEFLKTFEFLPGDTVLVKGSRGMQMEKIVDYLLNNRY